MNPLNPFSSNNYFNLISLPELPECQMLDCSGCTSLTSLPALPQCQMLDCSGSSNMTTLPELPSNTNSITTSINVNIEQLSTEPVQLLLSLGNEFLLKGKPFPDVKYYEDNQPSMAIDAGGVKRDFITRLCENLFKNNVGEDDYGKFLLSIKKMPNAITDDNSNKQAYQTLGVLFALCYQSKGKCMTGPIFEEKFYQYLATSEKPGSEEWLLRNYLKNKTLSTDIIDYLVNPQGVANDFVSDDLIKLAYTIDPCREDDGKEFSQEFVKENRITIKNKLLNLLNDDQELMTIAQDESVLKAISWITEGMKGKLKEEDWNALRTQNAREIQNVIEGVIVNANDLKNKLTWWRSNSVNQQQFYQIQQYLTNWINQNSDEEGNDKEGKLSEFTRAVTGSKSLSDLELYIEIFDREKDKLPFAHTCTTTLELSADYTDQDKFNEMLEQFISGSLSGTGFTDI